MRGAEVDARPAGRRAWRVLVGALVALTLLVLGVGDSLPRALVAAGSVTGSAAGESVGEATGRATDVRAPAAPPAERTSMDSPAADLVVRGAALAVVPAPTGPVTGLLPGGAPLVAPHLVPQPQARPPTQRLPATAPGAPGSRGPPATTGA